MKEPGYVYILTNPSFREDWVKIGRSSRPVDVRSKELDNTAVPLPFEIYATMKTVKYVEAEKLIHRFIETFTNLRIRDNREFFNVKPEKALEIFRPVAMVLDDVVIEETYKSSMFGVNEMIDCKHRKSPSTKTPPRKDLKIWMIPASPKYFDHMACFRKYGYIYWKQHFNFQTGDIIYIYVSNPEGALKYKCIVEGHDMPYSVEMDVEREFFANPQDFDSSKSHNRFIRLRLLETTKSERMSMVYLMEHGMKRPPQGSMNLSHPSYMELLEYIEKNF